MAKFRKKPIIIEALKWTGDNFADIAALGEDIYGPYGKEDAHLEIKTLEGRMIVGRGDWVIRGVNGEVYPCKPDIFSKTYDPIGKGEWMTTEKEIEERPMPERKSPPAGLTEGRIVHYVMPNGEHRPAIVTQVWDRVGENGTANLFLFTDCSNDLPYKQDEIDLMVRGFGFDLEQVKHGHTWRTSIMYSKEPKPHTWHWIEPA